MWYVGLHWQSKLSLTHMLYQSWLKPALCWITIRMTQLFCCFNLRMLILYPQFHWSKKAIYSWCSHEKWWFSLVSLCFTGKTINSCRRDVKVTSLHICIQIPGLVSVNKKLWKDPPMFNGKINYFDWAMFNSYLCMFTRGNIPSINHHCCWFFYPIKPSFIPCSIAMWQFTRTQIVSDVSARGPPRHNDACGAVPPSNTWSSGAWWLPGGVFMVILFTKNGHLTRDFTVFSPSMGWWTMGKLKISWDWVLISSNLSWFSYHIWWCSLALHSCGMIRGMILHAPVT